ncbi:MAG: calcium/sodium antiporter [bacterium]|nr:calcium/sodium antiporter [bacterium]
MQLALWIGIFAVSLIVLIKAADYFTEYAEKIGLLLRLSPFIVGVTIVAIGTSIPELASGIIAALKGGVYTAYISENVIGSNIANIFLVVGLGAFLGGALFVKRNLIHIDLPILALTTTLFLVFVMWDGKLARYEAFLLLLSYGVYLWYVLTHRNETEGSKNKIKKEKWSWKIPLIMILSVVAIYYGAKYTIDSVLTVSQLLGINSALLVMTVVAFGTSLPELTVTIMAVRKKDYEVALGNVFGSNIFNATMVVGITGLISPLVISKSTMLVGLPFLGIATLLYFISAMDREVKNYEGAMFLLMYIAFVISLITLSV